MGRDDDPHLGVHGGLLIGQQRVCARNRMLIRAHLSQDKIDLAKRLWGSVECAVNEDHRRFPHDPGTVVTHEDHHEVLLVVIHKVTVSQEDSACGGNLKLLWRVIFDVFG